MIFIQTVKMFYHPGELHKDTLDHHGSFTIFDQHSTDHQNVQVDFQSRIELPKFCIQFEPQGFTCSEPCYAHIKRPIFW